MGKPLTIAMLGLSPKGKSADDEPEEVESESGDDELPLGLVEAAGEMREAEDDEAFARALHNAIKCCS